MEEVGGLKWPQTVWSRWEHKLSADARQGEKKLEIEVYRVHLSKALFQRHCSRFPDSWIFFYSHLIGVVSADVAERGGRRLAEQRGGVAQQSADADVFRVRDVGERRRREHGGRPGRGGGGGREVGQALRQAVHVDLDLWVVEVFLAVAVVRVAVPAASRNIRREMKMSAHLF